VGQGGIVLAHGGLQLYIGPAVPGGAHVAGGTAEVAAEFLALDEWLLAANDQASIWCVHRTLPVGLQSLGWDCPDYAVTRYEVKGYAVTGCNGTTADNNRMRGDGMRKETQ
jgi:hypothetical protein